VTVNVVLPFPPMEVVTVTGSAVTVVAFAVYTTVRIEQRLPRKVYIPQ